MTCALAPFRTVYVQRCAPWTSMTAQQIGAAATAAAAAALPDGDDCEDVALGRLAGRNVAVVGSCVAYTGTVLVAKSIDARGLYEWCLPAEHESAILQAAGLAELSEGLAE
ncbi:hypothetical protein [Variovorax rhizosphaerae]|uniref:Uncharacterized protein n=1 Tax=Variovorax rhizosphaerae TaxID=1836200 RepID=A0ABU8WJH1_9BURK